MLCYTSHYRNKINFTFEGAEAAQTALKRFREGFLKHKEGQEIIDNEEIKKLELRFLEAINDDLNMPVAMSIVWEIIRDSRKSNQFSELLLKFDEVLGLNLKEVKQENKKEELPEKIIELMNRRKEARQNKDWALSDSLRDEIISLGYSVKDTKEGMEVSKI